GPVHRLSRTRAVRPLLRHRSPHPRGHRRSGVRLEGGRRMTELRKYQAPVWDEPLIVEMGAPGQRGAVPPAPIDESAAPDIPASLRRTAPPVLPEIAEYDVLRHYLHLSQETMGMVGISLFGTCTMKYNPRVAERFAALGEMADVHPHQDDSTVQGLLEIVHR